MPGFVTQEDVNIYDSGTSSGTFLSGLWGGLKGVLNDGLSIYSDYLSMEGSWHGNYNPYPERYQPTPPGMPSTYQTQQQLEWVPGVSNGIILAGAAGLIALIALKG